MSAACCCIGESKRSSSEPTRQRTYQLVGGSAGARDPPHPQCRADGRRADGTVRTTASALEDAVCSLLASEADVVTPPNRAEAEDGEEEEEFDPVRIYHGDDAHLLRCRPPASSAGGGESAPTIFGIVESAPSLGGPGRDDVDALDGIPVCLKVVKPSASDCGSSNGCCCSHPRGDWRRRGRGESSSGCGGTLHASQLRNGCSSSGSRSADQYLANVTVVDLTGMQSARRRRQVADSVDAGYPCFDTPGKVFHLLRSILCCEERGLHCASPWSDMYCASDGASPCGDSHCRAADQVVALLVRDPNQKKRDEGGRRSDGEEAGDRFWDGVEEREADELVRFRTGDAAPSYFLHSTSQMLTGLEQLDVVEALDERLGTDPPFAPALLLVYRHLPPRDVLAHGPPSLSQAGEYVGCLRETYLEDAKELEANNVGADEPRAEIPAVVVKRRMVSPPYLSHSHEYPGLLDPLLERIDDLRSEALKIPQWTAWPEQNHYSGDEWSVFPLCYTFPATDLERRTFVERTCSFAPETTKALRALGPALRTALFSRLDPRARLGAHTGWSDLANHVLRVHIPLVVPGGRLCPHGGESHDVGLCGTWVDGVVETHDEGRVVCFDDSKVHRAFNYSEGERIVLIVDLARPRGLPPGSATGGHSDELDAFISAF